VSKAGINLNGPLTYSTGPMFLDCLRQCASNVYYCPWFTGNSGTFDTNEEAYVAPTLDANGNPTTLTVAGIPGGQQFTKLFTFIYMNMGSPPAGATINYTAGQYTFVGKIGGSGSAATISFTLTNDVTSLASQTAGVTVVGNTVTSTLAPGSTFTLTFTASGTGGLVITIPAGSAISSSCYFDFASGHMVPTAYLADYTAGKILHPAFKAEISGDGTYTGYNGPLRFMTLQKNNQQEWLTTFTGNLASSAVSGTLSTLSSQQTASATSWPWPTGSKNFLFGNGQVISVSGTFGSTAVTWSTPLSSAVATSAIGGQAVASEQLGWANRPKLGNLSWCGPQGLPLEAMIQAGNEVSRDVYLCIPASAMLVDSGWLSSFVALLNNGTGANLSGSNITSFTGLSASFKYHLEFTNEVFNQGSRYRQAQVCIIMGVAAGYYAAQGNSQLAGAYEWVGTQLFAIGTQCATTFGASRSTRVAMAAMTQFATGNGTAFMEVMMNTPDAGTPAYPQVDEMGFAPYCPSTDDYSQTDAAALVALGTTAGVTKIFSHMWAADPSFPSVPAGGLIGSKITRAQSLISSWSTQPWASKPLVAYECGSALDDAGNYEPTTPGWRALLDATQTDSRFQYVYYDPTHQLSANNGAFPALTAAGFTILNQLSDVSGLGVAGQPAGSFNWGALQSYMQTISPLSSAPSKFQGLINFVNASKVMTPVQAISHSAGGGTSQSLSFLALPTVGNYIIVKSGARGSSSSAQVASIVDNQGGANTYAQAVQAFNTISGAAIFIGKVNVSSGTFTITVNWTSTVNGHAIWLEEMAATDISGVIDQTGTAGSTGTATTFSVTAIAPNTNAGDFVSAVFSSGTSQAAAIGLSDPPATGYTSEGLFDSGAVSAALDAGYKTASGIETSSAGWTSTTAVAWSAAVATFLPASSPPPSTANGNTGRRRFGVRTIANL